MMRPRFDLALLALLGLTGLGLAQAERDEPLVYTILAVGVLKAWLVQGAFMGLDRSPRLWGALASLTALVALGFSTERPCEVFAITHYDA